MIYVYQSGDTFSVSADKRAPLMFKNVAPRVYDNATDAFKVETHGRIRDALKLFGVETVSPAATHHVNLATKQEIADKAYFEMTNYRDIVCARPGCDCMVSQS